MKRRTPAKRVPRARGPRPDWVYRSNQSAPVTPGDGNIVLALPDLFGTYETVLTNLDPGPQVARAWVLYDSKDRQVRFERSAGILAAPVLGMGSAAGRAEGSTPLIQAVEGKLTFLPATWAIGTFYGLGLRIGIFKQDINTGVPLVHPDYSMWVNVNATKPADHANSKVWQWERRYDVFFNDNNQVLSVPVRFRTRRRLRSDECYAVYAELEPGSVRLQCQRWLRTLVVDEG